MQISSNNNRFVRFIDGPFVQIVVVLAYAYFFLIILSEVFMRYFFQHSTNWGEMTARYAFVYFAYIAAAEAFRHDEHIRIDLLPNKMGETGRKALETYGDFLCILISIAVIYYSLSLMEVQQRANIRMHALPVNMSWAQLALPVGWGLMIIRILQRVRRRFFTAATPKAELVT
ncbi:MAG: TRAP transporter small permease [Paracoccaceae bacterium]